MWLQPCAAIQVTELSGWLSDMLTEANTAAAIPGIQLQQAKQMAS